MNRLRILFITTALLMGSSVLASAEEYHHDARFTQARFDRDHDRRDDHFRQVVYPDHRWVDASGRLCYDPAFWRFDVRLHGWVRR